MSKQLDVLNAVKAMIAAAVAPVQVLGLLGDDAAPDRVGDEARVVVRSGDPGEPEVDLSPVSYNYDHAIPLEITANPSGSLTALQVVDALLVKIAAAIEADRTMGGRVVYLDAFSPLTDDEYSEGSSVTRRADATLVASYSTPHPL